jgi:type II secretory pathway pseudopilin PulG
MRRRRQRGATLLEIMISLALVLVGMLALFKVLTTSISGTSTSSRLSQAQVRAITILESIRHSPMNTFGNPVVLSCLQTNNPSNWTACETLCKSLLTAPSQDACLFTLPSFSVIKEAGTAGTQVRDRSQQFYIMDTNNSSVTLAGTNGKVFDVQLIIGWNDDNDQANIVAGNSHGWHQVKLRTGVFE